MIPWSTNSPQEPGVYFNKHKGRIYELPLKWYQDHLCVYGLPGFSAERWGGAWFGPLTTTQLLGVRLLLESQQLED